MALLSISLFSSMSVWHIILKKGIEPFVNDSIPFILFHHIEFNYLCGENLRFSICCKEENAIRLAKNADAFFKLFFLSENFPTKKIKLPIAGIFLPFPSNTIQFGLYQPQLDGIFTRDVSSIQEQIFSKERVHNESVITFAIYLHLGLIRAQSLVSSDKIHGNLFRVEDNLVLHHNDQFFDRYKSNKIALEKIYHYVLFQEPKGIKKDTPWLDAWITTCSRELTIYNNNDNEITRTLSIVIESQLGFTKYMKWLLFYFLENMINDNG